MIRCPRAMTKIDTWLLKPKNGCVEAPLAYLGPRISNLPPMKNDFRPFNGYDKVVWALGHLTTWAHDKMEWTLCYLGARKVAQGLGCAPKFLDRLKCEYEVKTVEK
jgi:hypothetical protein